jgi:type II secretory ATPase GspE/PulE/Tfp pilus assembly ATPase PilB-like protein
MLNKEGVNIVTLEDPVEYVLEGVGQSQVRPDIGYTFASGLRSILRQDPDIVMVGEIRDSETAELAVHAALTGHLVLSTLHTNTAMGSISRLVDMGIKAFLLASALKIVIGQRLVRRICVNCKKEREDVPVEVLNVLKKEWLKLCQLIWLEKFLKN